MINSFSKYFGMTGWRLGWLVAPRSFIGHLDTLAQNLFLAASTPAQYAALAAFEPDTPGDPGTRRQRVSARRDFLLPALRGLGFEIPRRARRRVLSVCGLQPFQYDSFAFANELLESAGVAITPGIDFGQYKAPGMCALPIRLRWNN